MFTKTLFSLMLVLTGMSLFAQDCDCLHEFEFVKNYMEANHPGLNSGTKNTIAYKKEVKKLRKEIIKVKPVSDCNLYLNDYRCWRRTIISGSAIPCRI